jgi:5-methylcytosine-specific restriction endonuclease McrA
LASNRRSLAKIDPKVRKQRNREAQVRYWAKHGERLRAHRRKRFASIPKIRTQVQEWKKANPDRVKILRNKGNGIRRARERLAAIGDLTDIAKVYERAKWWQQWFDVVVDHTISLARGGAHAAKNLQIIYRFENEKKGTRSDYKPRVIFA